MKPKEKRITKPIRFWQIHQTQWETLSGPCLFTFIFPTGLYPWPLLGSPSGTFKERTGSHCNDRQDAGPTEGKGNRQAGKPAPRKPVYPTASNIRVFGRGKVDIVLFCYCSRWPSVPLSATPFSGRASPALRRCRVPSAFLGAFR